MGVIDVFFLFMKNPDIIFRFVPVSRSYAFTGVEKKRKKKKYRVLADVNSKVYKFSTSLNSRLQNKPRRSAKSSTALCFAENSKGGRNRYLDIFLTSYSFRLFNEPLYTYDNYLYKYYYYYHC